MLLAYSLIGCIAGVYGFCYTMNFRFVENPTPSPKGRVTIGVLFGIAVGLLWPFALGARLHAILENN